MASREPVANLAAGSFSFLKQGFTLMRCTDSTRLWLRTAMVLHRHYRQRIRPQLLPTPPSLEAVQKRTAHFHWARQQQLPAAVRQCRLALEHSLQSTILSLSHQLETLRKPETSVPSVSQLYAEIAALQDEFERVTINLRQRQISVTTERIVLEDFDLGPFEIRLDLNRLTESSPYTVTALDSDQSSSGNPHPHVSDHSLCEGDGTQAIASTLTNGLISEFFVLVRQILRTYNEASAYRKLDEWQGIDCAACSDIVSAEDCYCCDSCHCSLCSDCEYRCETCHSSLCYDCSESCDHCDDRFCRSCTKICADCDERFCKKCLTAGRCTSCSESDEEISDDHDEATPDDDEALSASTEAEVHADCLVEVVVRA